jgi:D-glycero-alpha-D-manno-heptose-7-phosphate kinase
MIIRSKAPLRLGLAGGGTDVSPYSDLYGGRILNATINMFAHTTIFPKNNGKIHLESCDLKVSESFDSAPFLEPEGPLLLLKGVYNRIVREFNIDKKLAFEAYTTVDAPPGSGLGSSSTLVVSIVGAFVEWLKLPLGEYDIARLAYEIEREDLNLAGGKQDQYAATFGGFNFMEFSVDKVIVNPLRIKQKYAAELEYNLVLFYMGSNRESAEIIKKQSDNVTQGQNDAIEATHQLKKQSLMMKEAVLTGNIDNIGKILNQGWEAKKKMAFGISNDYIDNIYKIATENGATGGKISGAGGGGYFFFYCPGINRHLMVNALKSLDIHPQNYHFTKTGLYSYTI